jgi:hypothetical protein
MRAWLRRADLVSLWAMPIVITALGLLAVLVVGAVLRQC